MALSTAAGQASPADGDAKFICHMRMPHAHVHARPAVSMPVPQASLAKLIRGHKGSEACQVATSAHLSGALPTEVRDHFLRRVGRQW